jgi:aminobenzoyl-glutamate utilization protein B
MEQEKLSGTVKYYGCPGEEGGSGKAFMARAGVFKGLDAALTWHSGSTTAVASGSSLANIQVYYKFKGKSSHAAASPHLGRSALDAVELMNVGVNYMREHMVSEARVHYAVINTGGKSPNVVQPEAEVLYLIRSPKNSQVADLFEWVNDIARGAAMMTQTQVQIQVDKACSNLVPNLTLEKLLHENLSALPEVMPTPEEEAFAREIRASLDKAELEKEIKSLVDLYGGPEGRKLAGQLEGKALSSMVLPHKNSEKPMMGSTDVSDVSWIVPTAQAWISCWALGTPGHSWQQVAQGKSSWAHKGMLLAAKALAGTALDLMTNPELLEQAKADLKEQLAGEEYRCPIPPGVKPAPVK